MPYYCSSRVDSAEAISSRGVSRHHLDYCAATSWCTLRRPQFEQRRSLIDEGRLECLAHPPPITVDPDLGKMNAETGSLITDEDVSASHVVPAGDNGGVPHHPCGDIDERDLRGRSGATASIFQPFSAIHIPPTDINVRITGRQHSLAHICVSARPCVTKIPDRQVQGLQRHITRHGSLLFIGAARQNRSIASFAG